MSSFPTFFIGNLSAIPVIPDGLYRESILGLSNKLTIGGTALSCLSKNNVQVIFDVAGFRPGITKNHEVGRVGDESFRKPLYLDA